MPSDAERIAEEIVSAANVTTCDGYYEVDIDAAAAVIERAIADAVEQERARIERLKGYAVHDDTCEDRGAYPGSCTCGLSRLLKEIGDG